VRENQGRWASADFAHTHHNISHQESRESEFEWVDECNKTEMSGGSAIECKVGQIVFEIRTDKILGLSVTISRRGMVKVEIVREHI
jgi:hypothetical protein